MSELNEVAPPFFCSREINLVAAALVKAQAEMEYPEKDANNPGFRGAKYAQLATHFKASREALANYGLCVTQVPRIADSGAVVLDTVLLHSSGQYLGGTLPVLTTQNTMQAIGSGITYARRYGYSPIIGTAQVDDDDDGNRAASKSFDKEDPPAKPLMVAKGNYTPKKIEAPAPAIEDPAPDPLPEVDSETQYNHSLIVHRREVGALMRGEGIVDKDMISWVGRRCHGTPLGDLPEVVKDLLRRRRAGEI